MKRSTSKKLSSIAITIPISIALAAVWWLILLHLFDYPFGLIGIIATVVAMCAIYWFTIMKWQRSEALPLMRYARMFVCAVVQMIFLAIAHSIYFSSHPIDSYAPYTAVVKLWFLIAPFAQYLLTELTFRQLHRLRVRLMQMRLYTRMLRNQIKNERKK